MVVIQSRDEIPKGARPFKELEAALPKQAGAVIIPGREPPAGKRPFHPWSKFTDYKSWGMLRVGKNYKRPRFHHLKAATFLICPMIAVSYWFRNNHFRRLSIWNPSLRGITDGISYWSWLDKSPIDLEKNEDLREAVVSQGVDPARVQGLLAMTHLPSGGGGANFGTLHTVMPHIPGEKPNWVMDFPPWSWMRWWRVPALDKEGNLVWVRDDSLPWWQRMAVRGYKDSDLVKNPQFDQKL